MVSDHEQIYSDIATELARAAICIRPDFLNLDEVAELSREMIELRDRGSFRPAGVGHKGPRNLAKEVRQDEICWFEPTELRPAQDRLWAKIEQLTSILNRELFLGLWDIEAHFAIYAPGGFYKSHLDSFVDGNKRVLSMVIYLNQHWQPADGGELKAEVNGENKIVEPRAGTMVCFLSEKIRHEVLIAHKERTSIAAWLRRR